MATKTIEKPSIEIIPEIGINYGMKLMSEEDTPWQIIIHDNDFNSFEEVIEILVKAIECSVEKAGYFAHTVHTMSTCIIYTSTQESCQTKATIIETIGMQTTVQQV